MERCYQPRLSCQLTACMVWRLRDLPVGSAGSFLEGFVINLFDEASSVWGFLVGYPLACLAARLLVGWLAPSWHFGGLLLSWRSAAAPLLWLPRYAVWQPTWWLTGAPTGACSLAAERADKLRGAARRQAIQPEPWVQLLMLVVVW